MNNAAVGRSAAVPGEPANHAHSGAASTAGSGFVRTLRRAFTAIASLVSGLWLAVWGAVGKLLSVIESWLLDGKKARYGLAVTRILLGVMVMGMVLTNLPALSYTFGPGAFWTGQLEYPTSDFAKLFPFSLVNQASHTEWGIWLVAIALFACGALFTLGYRTKLVMIPLFVLWVGFLSINTYVQDQSDNLTRISLIALVFSALSDRWSLDARRRKKWAAWGEQKLAEPSAGFFASLFDTLLLWWRAQRVLPSWMTSLSNNLSVAVLIAQLCFVYGSGGLFKADGLPWQNGTAVYAPLHTMRFGTWPVLSDLATAWGPAVAIATIGTVLVQVGFPLMMLNRFTRVVALAVIMMFHLGIGVMMGLPWFSLSMVALDAVFIRDRTWKRLGASLGAAWNRTSQHPEQLPAVAAEPAQPTHQKAPQLVAGS